MQPVVVLLMFVVPALAAAPPIESTVPPELSGAGPWYAAESTIEPVASAPERPGPALHWHCDVDYFAGEEKYPIGWPRFGTAAADGVWDWTGYDTLRFAVRVESSRAALPTEALGLGINMPDRSNQYNLSLPVKQNEWVEVEVPIDRLSAATQVSRLQFDIAESNYTHGDRLDVWISGLRLDRYTAPTVLEFRPLEALLGTDTPYLVAVARVAGGDRTQTVSGQLIVKQAGQIRATVPVTLEHGLQRLVAPVTGLQPGPAELSIDVGGLPTDPATVTVVTGPFAE